ncbi:MAG: very short patch repair endonuclease [Bacteriovoracia bacterium]
MNIPQRTNKRMAKVKSKNTSPEMIVRKLVWHMGYRYRLHLGELPGKPDLVFVKKRKVIFVNGCFWHRHDCKSGRSFPSTNQEFWEKKFLSNIERDKRNIQELHALGWEVLVLWECEIKELYKIKEKIMIFLSSGSVP